ncbi:MAG: sulfatase-like hydrolase/transferase [Planctomycetaceae bacterium]|nr:sulfatase-like hydrolase/transferase [Planctomycetaceae bacterium]
MRSSFSVRRGCVLVSITDPRSAHGPARSRRRCTDDCPASRRGRSCHSRSCRDALHVILTLVLGLWCQGIAFAESAAASDATPQQTPPNVVVFLSDDQGWGDLSLNGNTNLSTPNIDRMAAEGARFDRFFVCPVCSPTRAEFLTGRYHPRGGVFSTSAGGERLDLDEVTIADSFRAAGYATAAFGKWHNGMQYPYHPNGRGFTEYYGFCSGHWGHYFSPQLEHNQELTTGEGYLTDDFTNHAIRFIQAHHNRPFFLYVPYNTPHSPMQVPDQWWQKFADRPLALRHRDPDKEDPQFTRAALAMCENIDWNVGRLLEHLEKLNLADDTIVVYFCDNGPNGWRWNGGMRGRKGTTDEGGVRSPLVIRWPGKIGSGKVVPQIAGAIDLLPTLADLCGVEVVSTKTLDGRSLKPLLVDQNATWEDRMIFSTWNRKVSVRTQQYRLDSTGKLYDMLADPGQDQDVSKEHPELTRELRAEVEQFKNEVMADFDKEERPFLVGHPDFRYTQLPARDADSHGGIERSNRHANCTYFRNWTSSEDSISWNVEVAASGTYEVEVYYTCPQQDVGSTIELSLNGQRVSGKVSAANDPPEKGAAEDRVVRVEGYVKDFKPLQLGRIRLEEGTGFLTLRALEIPGDQVMEMRLVMLTRVDD